MKTILICQFANSQKQLPVFLSRHLELFDKIILLDHNSDKDYRFLSDIFLNLEVFRISEYGYKLDVFWNAVIHNRELNLIEEYDYLFILDIDEFMPFVSKSQFERWLMSQKKNRLIKLFWKNALFTQYFGEIKVNQVLSPVSKLGYNLNRLKRFYVEHGNHGVSLPILDKLLNRILISKNNTSEPCEYIYHFPLFSKDDLSTKLNSANKLNFRNKILQCSPWFEPFMRDMGLVTDEIFERLVADYRNRGRENAYSFASEIFPVNIEIFEKVSNLINNAADTTLKVTVKSTSEISFDMKYQKYKNYNLHRKLSVVEESIKLNILKNELVYVANK